MTCPPALRRLLFVSQFFFFFETQPARFSVVVPDLFARAPQKYFCRKLCVYLMCVTGAGEMAGIMGFIYVHTHLLCPVSGTLTRGTHSSRDTSLVPPCIERAFTCRGVSQRDSENWKSRSTRALRQGLHAGHEIKKKTQDKQITEPSEMRFSDVVTNWTPWELLYPGMMNILAKI